MATPLRAVDFAAGLRVIESASELRRHVASIRSEGGTIGFVPTMGFLHDGHLSLVREAAHHHELVVISIYVNPTQFGPGEDLDAYPRDFDGDCEKAASAGAHVVYKPRVAEIYPSGVHGIGAGDSEGPSTWVTVEGLGKNLCGTDRPTHFRGVTTVVSKLFNLVQPDAAYFGQKDYQQLTIVRRMTTDMCMPVEIVGVPTVREPDGLAMSSRNAYLTDDQRAAARVLVEALRATWDAFQGGVRAPDALLDIARGVLAAQSLAMPQYISLVDPDTLEHLRSPASDGLLALAVKFGDTRLIDNVRLTGPRP